MISGFVNYLRNKKILQYVLMVFSILLIACLSFSFSNAVALNDKSKLKGLTLSPLRSEINITPGTSFDGVITVTNSSEKDMTVALSAEKFSVINQQYDYEFDSKSDIAKWVSFGSNELILKPNESKKILYTIGVPLAAEPGGRYISLFASSDVQSNGGVSLRERVGSLVYITVQGNVTKTGRLLSLASPMIITGDSDWSAVLQDTGTAHFYSIYSLKIQGLFGQSISTNDDAMILPGTIRLISAKLSAPKIPGIYKLIYTFGLGDSAAVVETRYILYMPVWATALLVSITAFVIWLKRRPKKVHKKH